MSIILTEGSQGRMWTGMTRTGILCTPWSSATDLLMTL